MSRPQFSLKSLLCLVVLLCVLLGGWHWLDSYGQYIEAKLVGDRIVIRGRVIRLFGPSELDYTFTTHGLRDLQKGSGKRHFFATGYSAKRSSGCFYKIQAAVKRGDYRPDQYRLCVYVGRERQKAAECTFTLRAVRR